jgi:O-antigen ligase
VNPIPVPIEYLHLQTGAIFLLLLMIVRTEMARAAEATYDVHRGFTLLKWLPAAFVLMAVAFTKALGDVSPFLGLELAAGISLSLLHPVNALCFLVQLLLLRPWEVVPDNQLLSMIPRFGIGLCLFSWMIHPGEHARLNWRTLRGLLFLAAFAVWILLTILKAPSIVMALTDWFQGYFKTLMIFAVALFLIESERSVREVQATFVISSLALMASGIYQYLYGEMIQGRMKLSGALADPNDTGAIIAMALPFALVPLFEETSGPLTKAAGACYACLAAFAVWLTRSRGTILAIGAEYLAVRAAKSRNRVALVLTALALGVGYQGVLLLIPRSMNEMEASQGSRLTFWKSAVNMAVHNPILGVGFDQYPENYMSYAVGTIYERGRRTTHSSWLLALAETGFVGFFLFCSFFASVARLAWRNRDKRPAQLYSVVGYGVAMSFLSHTYSLDFYLLMALVLASACVQVKAPHAA